MLGLKVKPKIAISLPRTEPPKDSIILVAGKGHEKYQIIGEKSIPHDDKEILKKLIL